MRHLREEQGLVLWSARFFARILPRRVESARRRRPRGGAWCRKREGDVRCAQAGHTHTILGVSEGAKQRGGGSALVLNAVSRAFRSPRPPLRAFYLLCLFASSFVSMSSHRLSLSLSRLLCVLTHVWVAVPGCICASMSLPFSFFLFVSFSLG